MDYKQNDLVLFGKNYIKVDWNGDIVFHAIRLLLLEQSENWTHFRVS